jgi:uncharacterized protein YndB with AHSA1/START domain
MPDTSDRTDGRLDLTLERTIDAPRALVWRVWTDPEHVRKWFAPAPWTIADCEMDLRPGGVFRFVLRSSEGQDFPELGCFLEVVEQRKIAWTNVLRPGFRPARLGEGEGCADLPFTAILTLEDRAGKTHYFVRVLHQDEAGRNRHEEMGFHQGWNQCLDQLIDLVTRLKG